MKTKSRVRKAEQGKMKGKEKEKRTCPYCESQVLEAGYPYCKPCGVTLRFCPRCQRAVERER